MSVGEELAKSGECCDEGGYLEWQTRELREMGKLVQEGCVGTVRNGVLNCTGETAFIYFYVWVNMGSAERDPFIKCHGARQRVH